MILTVPWIMLFPGMGGKYKGRLLWYLKDGILRNGELRRKIIGITPKMLTQVLRELEEDGLISWTEYVEVPPRVEYHTPVSCYFDSGVIFQCLMFCHNFNVYNL